MKRINNFFVEEEEEDIEKRESERKKEEREKIKREVIEELEDKIKKEIKDNMEKEEKTVHVHISEIAYGILFGNILTAFAVFVITIILYAFGINLFFSWILKKLKRRV